MIPVRYWLLFLNQVLTFIGTTIKSLHSNAVSDSKSLLSHSRFLQTASPHIAPEEANLPRPYRATLSQLRSFFCSSLYSYREGIGLIPRPLCPSCVLGPHTTVHVFSSSLHPTPLIKLDLWEFPRLASEILSDLPFFDLFLLLIPLNPSFRRTRELGGAIIIHSEEH